MCHEPANHLLIKTKTSTRPHIQRITLLLYKIIIKLFEMSASLDIRLKRVNKIYHEEVIVKIFIYIMYFLRQYSRCKLIKSLCYIVNPWGQLTSSLYEYNYKNKRLGRPKWVDPEKKFLKFHANPVAF